MGRFRIGVVAVQLKRNCQGSDVENAFRGFVDAVRQVGVVRVGLAFDHWVAPRVATGEGQRDEFDCRVLDLLAGDLR
jgi:hypothetical protein